MMGGKAMSTKKTTNAIGDLSHSEMLSLTGLTNARLMTWYKRKAMPRGLPEAPGRGNRRRYEVKAVLVLKMMRILADIGLPLEDAKCLAPGFMIAVSTVISMCLADIDPLEISDRTSELLKQWPESIIAVLRHPEGWKRPDDIHPNFVSAKYLAVSLGNTETISDLRDWMRSIGLDYITMIDKCFIANVFLGDLQQIFGGRESGARK
jgi:DNA-binding transcriptional MerR regulator